MRTGKKTLLSLVTQTGETLTLTKKLALMETPKSSQATLEAKNLDCNIFKVLRRERMMRRRKPY